MKLKDFFLINEQSPTGQTLTINSPTGITITFNDNTNLRNIYDIFRTISGLNVTPNNWNPTQADKNRVISGTQDSIKRFTDLYNQKYPNQLTNLTLSLPTSSTNSQSSSKPVEGQPSKGDEIVKNVFIISI